MSKEYWCHHLKSSQERIYHDQIWGVAVTAKDQLFATLMLECQQAGLSWAIILKKEQALRQAFFAWDYQQLSQMSDSYIQKLLLNPEIIRHKGKIEAMRTNAQAFLRLEAQGIDFSTWLWQHVDFTPQTEIDLQLAEQISKQLKKWGFKFVGATTIYAYLEAIGMVNPHAPDCPCFKLIQEQAKNQVISNKASLN
ncbi:DNA-3-methyladenine glycosylase I [Psittacicella gerlachiana]|uniref:DNA-3-methyladenine glycosylase I n=1 Tax=Psittacicella gerlachiana TaxID=2028574 RepID=A0A3A1YN81_9GAMM|nr:DNA-3-methyladenine glycosylase I [Psittacicella gerlachiana]RIY37497.1 hypothetical protein CKF59_01695 [Psittacicella gerlachiana]